MTFEPLPIAGLHVVSTSFHGDERGTFGRLFCERELAPLLGSRTVHQINLSRTTHRGAVRGMHFQHAPHGEMKLVRCLRGRVWDVALDLRAGSPTFLRWHALELSADNARMIVIPEGCAHGFQVLEPDSELLYLHTACYAPEAEGGVHPLDPRAAIAWQLEVTGLSPRDSSHPLLPGNFTGIAP